MAYSSGERRNEPFWRLPFEDFHRTKSRLLFADIAKYRHSATFRVGHLYSANSIFIVFCENYQQRWLHIDCSVHLYRKSGSDLWAVGATRN